MRRNCQISAPANQILAAQEIFLRLPGRLVFDHLAHAPDVNTPAAEIPSHAARERPFNWYCRTRMPCHNCLLGFSGTLVDHHVIDAAELLAWRDGERR
jgi:hypothetical protein